MQGYTANLRIFLRGAVADEGGILKLPSRKQAKPEQIIDDLRRFAGICAVPVPAEHMPTAHYPLTMGVHPLLGPVLVRMEPSLLREDRFYAFSLTTGEIHVIRTRVKPELKDPKVLFDLSLIECAPTIKSMNGYVYAPVRPYLLQTVALTTLTSFLVSGLFIVNFNVLLHVVPTGSLQAYSTLAFLVALIVTVMLASQLILARARLFVDSLIEERQHILALSIMFSLSPTVLQKHGPSRVVDMIQMLTSTAKTYFEATIMATSLIALTPVLVLLYIRLSAGLFIFVVVLCALSVTLQAINKIRFHKNRQKIALREAKTQDIIFGLISHSSRVKFYGQERMYLDRWQLQETNHVRDGYAVTRKENVLDVAMDWTGKLAQIGGLLSVTLMVKNAANGQGALDVASAYLILHLTLSLYSYAPRVTLLWTTIGRIRIDYELARPLLNDIESATRGRQGGVHSSRLSVKIEELRLPHRCQFAGGSKLYFEMSGPGVIRISGESGSGKSTFLRCLLGVEEPKSGSIHIMNSSSMALSEAERQRLFAYVSQSVQLVPGSLRDNLILFAPPEANDSDVWEALRVVSLYDEVRALPLGLDTPIADARRGFSTGERQRVILAQAIMKKSDILVMDEAMSGLPKSLELEIFKRLKMLFVQIYFVSHRDHISAVADRTIMLETAQQAVSA
jgi:ABC-type bacteriocin/lantibiotic exporter with double-glycine peptidase domain